MHHYYALSSWRGIFAGTLFLLTACSEPPLPRFDLLINNKDYPDTRQMAGLPESSIPGIAPEVDGSEAVMLFTGLDRDQGYEIQWFVDGMEYPDAAGKSKLRLELGAAGRHQIKVCVSRDDESRCQEKFLFVRANAEENPVEPSPNPPAPLTPEELAVDVEEDKEEAEVADATLSDEAVEPAAADAATTPEAPNQESEETGAAPVPPSEVISPAREYNEVGQIGARADIYNESCSTSASNEISVTLVPKAYIVLSRFSVQSTACGLLDVKIMGEDISWENTQTLTPGRNTISLIGMGQELSPGSSYTITVVPKPSSKCPEGAAAPALGDARNCNSEVSIDNEELQIDYQKERVAIFDLVYNHAK